MTVYKNLNKLDSSNVYFLDNEHRIFYNKQTNCDKMEYIDYGLSILQRNIFDYDFYPDIFDLSDLFLNESLKMNLFGFQIHERFYEIGSFQGLNDINDFFKGKSL